MAWVPFKHSHRKWVKIVREKDSSLPARIHRARRRIRSRAFWSTLVFMAGAVIALAVAASYWLFLN